MSDGGVSIVTGGAGGIGAAVVEKFIGLGDTVFVVDYDGAAADETAERLNVAGEGRAIALQCDVASDEQNRALIARIRTDYGRLDRLVNNAGIHQQSKFGFLEYGEWGRILDVNLWSVASLTQAAATIWAERPGGAVVNMASRAWLAGGPLAYSASKAGIVGLTHSFAVELGKYNVTVNAIAPGTIPTALVASGRSSAQEYQAHLDIVSQLPLIKRLGRVDDVASTVAFLTSAGAAWITGEVLHVAGGAQLPPSGR